MTKVEQYEAIRQDHRNGNTSIHELARKHRVHRRTVREALASAQPPDRKTPDRPEAAFGPYREIVTEWLEADLKMPRKQRHTAQRIWQRLVDEHEASVSERTVRRGVSAIKADLACNVAKVSVVQEHQLGKEAEVDFGDIHAIIAGQMTKLQLFVMRLSGSGKSFHRAYFTNDSPAFLDGHVRAFDNFGGVPGRIRYDNLKPAVIDVLIGRQRKENQRFVLLRSHFGFDSFFCLPGIEGAHEKGGVEGEVGRFRRRWLVPVPVVNSLGELNDILARADITDDDRHVDGRILSVGEHLDIERPYLQDLTAEPFEVGTPSTARVDTKARISILGCKYSVPVRLVGRRVDVIIRPDEIEVISDAKTVATHGRVGGRTESLQLDHYLETLQTKPGALIGSTALDQARSSGAFTETHQRFWDQARRSLGDKDATKVLIEVLLLHRTMTSEVVVAGMAAAMQTKRFDSQVVAIEARRSIEGPVADVIPIRDGLCEEREEPSLSGYDDLLEVTQ
jgi:transposase